MAVPLKVVPDREPRRSTDNRAKRADSDRQPRLVVVAGRRRATRFFVSVTMVIALAMGGVVFLNTLLAKRQLQINDIDTQLSDELDRFEELRAERAELRAPSRLEPLAEDLGMVAVSESEFAQVDPIAYAQQLALNGRLPGAPVDNAGIASASDPMEQFRAVKELIEEGP